jgi:tetratricopeptide (TPR) repeat protein
MGSLREESDPGRALEHYAKALEINPTLRIPGHDALRALASLRDGDAGAAETLLLGAATMEPDNARYWGLLGVARLHRGRLEEALLATLRALALAPGHPGYRWNLAACHRLRFRRRPWRLDIAWAWFRASRMAARTAGMDWRRDLWPGPGL